MSDQRTWVFSPPDQEKAEAWLESVGIEHVKIGSRFYVTREHDAVAFTAWLRSRSD